uniref:BRCT domain-containing protein n=1 Tax=Kalmanozyma brasiliensis (strain GHG001) TaxID=1365824 RepID=V5F340_KALBG
MNRSAKAHRSTKIPNVKLRPAQRGIASAAESSSSSTKRSRRRDELLDDREDAAHFRRLRDDGQDHGAHLDADFIGTSAHPLKGAIISITGLSESKASLTQCARELGARVEGNLTEDVTHLIADRPGSEKYRFALELGMHIVSPAWILDIRDAWLKGEDVDAEELEQHHQLPALSNTTLCFSAVTGAERRRLVALATELGATVSDELRFDGTITHLVSATSDPSASSSVQHLLHFLDRSRHGRNGSREQAASRLLAVRPQWLDDCQQAGGCLSEQTYSIFVQLPDQYERSALISKARTKLPSPFLRQQEPVIVPLQSPFIASSRTKLALAESVQDSDASHADDPEDDQPITLGSRQKAAAAGDKSFDSILSQLRSHQASSTSRDPLKSHGTLSHTSHATLNSASSAPTSISTSALAPPSSTSTTTPTTTTTITRPSSHRNGLLGMSRASSFSPAPPAPTTNPPTMRKTSAKLVTLPQLGESTSTKEATRSQLCFQDKSFKICCYNPQQTTTLEQKLESSGGTVLPLSSLASADFMLVEPKASAAYLKALDKGKTVPVLHYWIEYCLHHEVFVEPQDYFAALPARVPLPLPHGNQLRLLLIGFEADTPELYHAKQLVEELGGTVVKQLKGESLTHVVCASPESLTGRRAERARSCGVPVVGLEFLINARQTGSILPPPTRIAIPELSPSAVTASSISTTLPSAEADEDEDNDQGEEADDQPDLPLTGCTVSRSKALAAQSALFERKVLQLGGCWQAQVNEDTTHMIHRGAGQPRESKDLDRFAFVVHPKWLDKCIDEVFRVDEGLFPASLNPAKSLNTVLSNSDGSASGNFLSQASQSAKQRRPTSQHDTQASQQTQTALANAAKPWSRSISADASTRANANIFNGASLKRARSGTRGQSEEIAAPHRGGAPAVVNASTDDASFDADVTLSGQVDEQLGIDDDDAAPAPSSQTLIEGEELEADDSIRDVRSALPPKGQQKEVLEPKQADAVASAEDPRPSADDVIKLLQSRELGKAIRKKSRAAPRARNQRSDEHKLTGAATDRNLPPEQILERQAQLDAQRAADAAANGYSLGMDKFESLVSASLANQSMDARGRVIWNDDRAQQEQTKMIKMLEQQNQAASAMEDLENHADLVGTREDHVEEVQVTDVADDAQAHGSRKRGAEDSFGAGRRGRHAWENRNSESPTKRPVP